MKTFCWFLLIVCILSCCKTRIQYEPVETVKKEYISVHTRDSIYERDSIHIREKGDTVYYTFYKYIDKYKYVTDTLLRIDTIPVIKPVPVKGDTVYQMKWYEEIIFYIGLISIFGGIIFLASQVIKAKLFSR